MKSILTGLLTILVIGVVGVLVLKSRGLIPTPNPTPTPSSSPNYELVTPSPAPSTKPGSATPAPTYVPTSTTKGGIVLGTDTGTTPTKTTVVTTTTVKHTKVTLASSDKCPSTITTELKDIAGNMTVKYDLANDYVANITVWKQNGEEIVSQTKIEDQGFLTELKDVSYAKFRIQTEHCVTNDQHWLTVTAEN